MMSQKKRDTSLINASSTPNATPDAPTNLGNPVVIRATGQKDAGVNLFCYCPTYRYLNPSNAAYSALRTSTSPYYIGLSEKFNFQPSDNSVWMWRRIIVAVKENIGLDVQMKANGAQDSVNAVTTRPFHNLGITSSVQSWQDMYDEVQANLFKGIKTTDWSDQMIAKVDNTVFTVFCDKTRRIASGNDVSAPRYMKHYQPINRTVVYRDEENGVSVTPYPTSVQSKPGVGNIYVFDLFQAPVPKTTTSSLTFSCTSTTYWHEK